jgi:uncharacterized protein with PIN domain
VRFLIDECLPPKMAELLRAAGHNCAHVYELGLGGQPDEQVMALADRENRILVSADTDFGELSRQRTRASAERHPAPACRQASPIPRRSRLANLEQVAEDLAAGALVVISDTRIRAGRLPMKQSD